MYWCIKGDVYPVNVKPILQPRSKRLGPVTVYRGNMGMTYSAKYIRTWDELTSEQKAKAYRNSYQANRQDALFRIAKDPTLESQYPAWIEQLRQERDRAISALERGEAVAPPRNIWE